MNFSPKQYFTNIVVLWLERNEHIFYDSVKFQWDKIKQWVAVWFYNIKEFKGAVFYDLIREWKHLM